MLAKTQSLLQGLMIRSTVSDCPLGAFKVVVRTCRGEGDCASVCIVNVFGRDENGRCSVVNEELCFGCTACVAQCRDHGVIIVENSEREYIPIEELLK